MGKAPTCMRGISTSHDRPCNNPVAPESVLCESCKAERLASVRARPEPKFRVEPLPIRKRPWGHD